MNLNESARLIAKKVRARECARISRKLLFSTMRHDDVSEKAAAVFFKHISLGPEDVFAAYHPIKSEFDPLTILHQLKSFSGISALPVVVREAHPLIFRKWTPGDPLTRSFYNIQVPLESAEEVSPDVVIVPLLAFDLCGRRLGQGGGFYDRTIARLRHHNPDVKIIGLGFDQQRVDRVPHGHHDKVLDGVITEKNFYKFS